jgi:hypothetical protein
VDRKPFLLLGGQINNSSAWPTTPKDVWPVIDGMHANTVKAPVYRGQMEPHLGGFDFSLVDMLVNQAWQHHVHLIVLCWPWRFMQKIDAPHLFVLLKDIRKHVGL